MARELDAIEADTYSRHRSAQMLEGVFGSIVFAAPEIAVKGLDAGAGVIVLLTMSQGVMQLFSMIASRPMQILGRRRTLRVFALAGRLPLLLIALYAGVELFVGVLAWQALSLVFIQTSWNALLRSNYRDAHRGTLFANANRWGALTGGVVSVAFGFVLHAYPEAYRVAYPLAVVLGIVACFLFAEIDVREDRSELAEIAPSLGFGELTKLLVKDRNFFTYEIGFMAYGVAFMATMTAKPLRFAGELDFSYPVILGGKAIFSLFMVLSMPVWGRLIDRTGPAGLKRRANTILIVSSLIYFAATEPWMLFVGDAVLGFAMAGVLIGWNLGPITFAPTAALAASYMQLHIAGVGVRALIGNPLGGFLGDAIGARWVFLLAAVIFAIGALIQYALERRLIGAREAGPATAEESVEGSSLG